MKAVVVRDWSFVTFAVEDVDVPPLAAGEVLIAVHTAPVSFSDTLIAMGRYQVKPVTPFTPGSECAGVIEAVGPGVTAFAVGDRVLAFGFIGDARVDRRILGSFAEKVVAPIANVAPAPASLSLLDASLLRGNYEASYFGLQEGRLKAGETLLVLGAAGGTGFAAVTIGKALGARVIASASSPERRALALSIGADAAIDSRAADWRGQIEALTGGRGVDVAYDPVGGDATERALRALAWRGRIVIIGFAAGAIPNIPMNLPLMKGATIVGINLMRLREEEPALAVANRAALGALVKAGRLALPPVAREYRLDQVGDAIMAVTQFEGAGRIVISINPGLEANAVRVGASKSA